MEAAMQGKKYIMGLFKDEDQVVSTLSALKETAYKFQQAIRQENIHLQLH